MSREGLSKMQETGEALQGDKYKVREREGGGREREKRGVRAPWFRVGRWFDRSHWFLQLMFTVQVGGGRRRGRHLLV